LGRALARRLSAGGHRVEVYDLDGERRRSFTGDAASCVVAPSLTDLGQDCEVVLSAVTDIAALKTAALGDADRPGFATSMRPGSLILHFGGGPYQDVLRLAGQLGSAGIGLIDVLACNDQPSEDGHGLELMVGGYDELVERARPNLVAIGHFTRVGPTGTATGLRALRGYVRAARLIALSEAMLIGRHAGISADLLARVFDGPVAAGPLCQSLTGEARELMRTHDLTATFKAVADAVAFSERIGVSGDCVAFARDMLADAMGADLGGDESTLLRHFTAMAAADQ
jgi:3-hydroxyisobutyrate dehydrogenase-like beta-hydroxyacid dehydrogenase